MATWNLHLTDALQHVRVLTSLQKEMRQQLNEYIDTMQLPEEIDTAKRLTAKIWMNHYIDGTCSFESLKNMLKCLGCADVLNKPPCELEVNEKGELNIYEVKNND